MNLPKKQAEVERIYRRNPDGKWQKKTSRGTYVEINPKQALKQPQISAASYGRRFE